MPDVLQNLEGRPVLYNQTRNNQILTKTITADVTFTAAECEYGIWELAGSLSGGKAITVPASPGRVWFIYNKTGQTITVKKSGGTGIAIADSKAAELWYSTVLSDVQRKTADITVSS